MQIKILTIFPNLFNNFLTESLIEKAIVRSLINIEIINIRDFADPPHYKVDDEPYGGGAGMLMKPEPLAKAIVYAKSKLKDAKVLLMSATGTPFQQTTANQLALTQELIIICGRYEGIDQRVIEQFVDLEINVGDFIVMGGEIPAMLIIEAITRLIPGVIGNQSSIENESFIGSKKILEAPQYTRPAIFNGMSVPEVLLSGDHQKIKAWREAAALKITKLKRPDLINE